MTNDKLQITNYGAILRRVILQPILFYTRLKEESWKEKSLSFLIITSWVLAAFVALAIFIIQFVPIGATLVEGIKGFKFIIILPVLLTLGFTFYMMTFLIIGGVMVLGLGAAFYLLALILHPIALAARGKGSLNRLVQSLYYSSGVLLAMILPLLLAILARFSLFDPGLFLVGFNFIFFLMVIFIYGLWAVVIRRTYGISKPLSFVIAAIPAVVLLVGLFVLDKAAGEKIISFVTPLK
ncbi:MAG: hypothetical protein ABIH50_02070 [bacterium]